MRVIRQLAAAIVMTLAVVSPAWAHVIVTPGQVGVAQELTFNVSVPNEQTTPVVELKLDIPAGVASVVPTEKTGWTIKTSPTGTDANITSIDWSGGQIPAGQRDDFSFSAQVPGSAGELDWKAYQTYGDGTVVHWDQKPNGSDDSVGTAGPYSVTHVINDLKPATGLSDPATRSSIALWVAIIALVITVASLARRR